MVKYQICEFQNELQERKWRVRYIEYDLDGNIFYNEYLSITGFCNVNDPPPIFETTDKEKAREMIDNCINRGKKITWKEINCEDYP